MRSNAESHARHALTLLELVVVLVILVALAGVLVPLLSSSSTTAQDTATRASMTALRNAVMAYYQDMKGIQVWNDGSVAPPGATGIPLTLRDLQIQPLAPNGLSVQNYDPFTRSGWRGPYVLQSTGTFLPQGSPASPGSSLDPSFYPLAPVGYPNFPSAKTPYTLSYLYGNPPPNPNPLHLSGDLAFIDGWGNPIVLQWPQTPDSLDVRAQHVRLVSAGAPTFGQTFSVLDTVTTTLMPLPSQRGDIRGYAFGKDYVLFILTEDQYP